ncbi:phosphoenolpyruvate--protein phosphotransferase [Actinoplanes sp. CA-051413]|uniref:phosphoenolpyruvate--protein phosphotransferase n=1 Tax=Actinoplanes sp. CA-051413 TaxID=3239899 RepID=UPI003D983068
MVGLVVVSHSRALARAAVGLAAEMIRGAAVPIEVAAGLDDTAFGTDAVAITEAVAAADRGDGVVVLMDLGSAVLSAELALELLADDLRDRVVLCPGPLVEGLLAAAVAAAGGAGRDEVAAEADAGLAGKRSQLGVPVTDAPDTGGGNGDGPSATVTVLNRHGLHARPAARLVTLARSFDAEVRVRNAETGSPWVPASSLSRIATLGVLHGHRMQVRASGPQARAAVEGIVALAGRAFDETEPASAEPEGPAAQGRAASPGIAIGPARHLSSAPLDIPDLPARGPAQERQRIDDALASVRQDLEKLRAGAGSIFDAHLLLLDDADLLTEVRSRIDAGEAAPPAWAAATARVAGEFEALADPYLKARAADVRAVADQMLRALLGVPAAVTRGSGVLIAADLTPAEAAALDPVRVAGVLLALGSPTAHSAILLRTRGIPAVVGAGPAALEVADGTPVALDGGTGEVLVAPSEAALAALRERARGQAARREQAAGRASAPAVTRDGVRVAVGANVGSAAEARAAAEHGADLIGLIRTEFLFLDRDAAPEVEEQEAAWREIAQALGGRRITVRTLDVGGDKPLRYLPAPVEQNPFLGVRGLRYTLRHPGLLADQLLAVVRVARDVPVSLMFPMVSTVDEVVHARRMLDEAVAREGGGEPAGLQVGIMVEVPAAALKAAAFAPYVDFLSIGTNDLTQYALAAERGNPALAALADGLDPGVLRLIEAVCRGAGERVTVAVCGELAGDEAAVPLLTGLGVRELSVAPRSVPAIKEAVRATDLATAAALTRVALEMPDAAAVRALLDGPG